jgi:hypothetical protein
VLLVTTTSYVPAVFAGVRQLTEVAEIFTKEVHGTPPTVTPVAVR